jgi:hypothetical protein
MFFVNAVQAAAIRRAHEVGGDLGAVAEFHIQFPDIGDDAAAAALCARMIAAWKPFPPGRLARKCRARLARDAAQRVDHSERLYNDAGGVGSVGRAANKSRRSGWFAKMNEDDVDPNEAPDPLSP